MLRNPVQCPKCMGTGQIKRKDLPPLMRGLPPVFGVRQTDTCPVCDGIGYVEGK